MPLSPPVSRQLRHARAIRADAFERADGLWDIEACLTDVKPRDTVLASGVRPNGLPIHELWLRITIDRKLNVVDAEASSAWVPYPGLCEASNPAYRALIGLNLLDNFRRHAARLLGGTVGCTHLTELCAVVPTAAIQAFTGDVWNTANGSARQNGGAGQASADAHSNAPAGADANEISNDKPPFQLGRCHTLRFDGEAVRQFYPRWYGHVPRSLRPREAQGAGAPAAHTAAEETAGKEVLSNSQTEGNHA
ncbi:DUF2889 domain-containing protein [Paraburkholderia sp. SARCC-3016]|uniref:DUF2889 domain-containing protein n=1 Tax=Paraburkholderia sp. SARCC-3016 TaxID=3058611 RepID=UPI002806724F|nr:DUF2889 domain-containing protein [Paraburkholderia sp. SARCC-3016]MDQ7975745.1 DUF2889 domain-containing protein [Paraburkholderia sp. SARCC-3016]